jgi:signal transduction histidine kinase
MLVAIIAFFYYVEQTPLASVGPFNHSFFAGVHDLQRTLFLIPVVYAAVVFRVRGVLVASFGILCIVLPRALLGLSQYPEALLRPVLFVAFAAFAGVLMAAVCSEAEREKVARAELSRAYEELSQYNQRLRESQEQLIRAEKLSSLGQLAASIAHEINNPLGTLLLHVNILLEECAENSGAREDLETIVDQANRCKRTISGLLNFARQTRVIPQPTDLAELVEKVLGMAPLEDDVNVKVVNELSDPVAEIDADQIVQVLTNLFNNAQHAMPEGGLLTITLSDDPESVTIRVSDTGLGIVEEHMDKLFDPFFTTKQIGMGTGLGLAVTHGIVKMHRGNITVESNADPGAGPTGTTFTVTLPRHEERAPADAGPSTLGALGLDRR